MEASRQMESIQLILEIIANREEGMTKTHIHLVECLAILRRSGLIEYDPLTRTYWATERGFRLLRVTKEINELVTT